MAKQYRMSFAQANEHRPEHPERTARRHGRGLDFDVTFQVWTNRKAMARSIRMQQKRGETDWIACVPLSDGEGY